MSLWERFQYQLYNSIFAFFLHSSFWFHFHMYISCICNLFVLNVHLESTCYISFILIESIFHWLVLVSIKNYKHDSYFKPSITTFVWWCIWLYRCPIPTCQTPKWRVKRLRPLPPQWSDLPPDVKDPIIREFRELFCFLVYCERQCCFFISEALPKDWSIHTLSSFCWIMVCWVT